MDYRTIEGTREEVLEHSDELAGCHVKVIVFEEKTPQSLAEVLEGKIGILEFDVPANLHQVSYQLFEAPPLSTASAPQILSSQTQK